MSLMCIHSSDSKRVSSREWLAIHGLAAQKLTIMDALSPTFIPHKSKYIPIIDKKVNSKVFDNVNIYNFQKTM